MTPEHEVIDTKAEKLAYVALMAGLHPALAATAWVLQIALYHGMEAANIHFDPMDALAIITIGNLANMGLEYLTLKQDGITANLTALGIAEIPKVNKATAVAAGYLLNTIGQTLTNPDTHLQWLIFLQGGSMQMPEVLVAQAVAGLINTAFVTGVIKSGKLAPVAGGVIRSGVWVKEKAAIAWASTKSRLP